MPITDRLREAVYLRDAESIWSWSDERIHHGLSFQRFLNQKRERPLCLVELLDPAASRKCSGRWTLEHVKCNLRMGKKAWDREDKPCPQCGRSAEYHLVILCWYHNVEKPPSKGLRTSIRAYLANAERKKAEQGGGGAEPGVDEVRV